MKAADGPARGAPAFPPLEPLREVIRRLEAAGVELALGGSGLMYALGLAERVHDWDLTTDATVERAHAALGDLEHAVHGNLGIHADHKLVCFGGTVEVICRMAFATPAGVCRIPTIVTGTWSGIPLGSPLAWAVAYALMAEEDPGRMEKSKVLFAHSAGHVDAEELEAIRSQPLPNGLAQRVAALAAAPRPRPGG